MPRSSYNAHLRYFHSQGSALQTRWTHLRPVELHNVFRPDEVRPSVDRADMLAGAPSADDEFYLVPAVLGE